MNNPTATITICKNCKFYRHIVRNPGDREIWYNQFCGVSELIQAIEPISGETRPAIISNNGYVTFLPKDYPPFMHCRDVNNGNCQKYESR